MYRKGKSYPSRYMVLVYARGRGLKVGFSVSSKVGNAVTRSRLRRFMREDFRMLKSGLKEGRYIFVARMPAKDAEHRRLTREMNALLQRAGLFREEANTDER
ncbi:MAG: ribonuclease P protein component [Clostridiales bacterium]|nr:ribonuclease P protein component [Clostridiales bacterium]